MSAGKKLESGETIKVSKWLQEMWELEEEHPITTGSLLSSKGWVPLEDRSATTRRNPRKAVPRKTRSKALNPSAK